jgi:hypothetical protein
MRVLLLLLLPLVTTLCKSDMPRLKLLVLDKPAALLPLCARRIGLRRAIVWRELRCDAPVPRPPAASCGLTLCCMLIVALYILIYTIEYSARAAALILRCCPVLLRLGARG